MNILKPKDISIGRFYERHYLADPFFYGTKFPKRVGGAWSGRAIGLQKPGYLGRLWYGTPKAMKLSTGGVFIAGGAAYIYWQLESD